MAILKEEAVDMRRVKGYHCLDIADLGYITWLLEQGCYAGLDARSPNSFPDGKVLSLKARLDMVKAPIYPGHVDRLFPSHDYPLFAVPLENFCSSVRTPVASGKEDIK